MQGLAGLDWLSGYINEAARRYENTLAALKLLDETNEKLGLTEKRGAFRKLRSDKLQVVHAMNSMIDLMKEGVEIRGIDLETAHVKLKEAEEGYTEQAISSVHSSHDAINEMKPQYSHTKTYMDNSIGWISEAMSAVERASLRHVFVDAIRGVLENNSRDDFPCAFFLMDNSIGWISEAMSTVERASLRHVFVDAIRGVLENNSRDDFPVHNALGVSLICVQRWDEMVACVKKTVELMCQLMAIGILDSPSEGLETIIACHYKSVETPKRNCDLCLFNKQLNLFESLMFVGTPPKKKFFDDEEETVEGTAGAKKASSLEIVLHTIRSMMVRNSGHFHRILLDGAKETESLIDLFKTILQKGKDLYGAYEDFAARTDELRQCKLRLEYASEEIIEQYGGMKDLPHNYIIKGSEEGTRRAHAQAVGTEELTQTRLLSKLRYVSTLRHSQRNDCPICLNRLGDAWLVFPCAHCMCTACFGALSKYSVSMSSVLKCPVCRSMTTRSSIAFVQNRGPSRSLHFLDSPSVVVKGVWIIIPATGSCFYLFAQALYDYFSSVSMSSVLKCPVCRSMTTRSSIAFVQNRGPSRSLHFLDSPSVVVKGDASVKLDAVIRRLLSIHERDPWAKTLVFTSIPSIIPVISGLLQENNIPYRNYSVGKRQVTLAEFRLDPKIQVLVMPINQGARGLNLTVANNIIFVEPQLDASQLAQAIGRIDRIGQTRRMMIHHFVVYGSIEEHIHHRITDPQNTEWTVGDLKRLLRTFLFNLHILVLSISIKRSIMNQHKQTQMRRPLKSIVSFRLISNLYFRVHMGVFGIFFLGNDAVRCYSNSSFAKWFAVSDETVLELVSVGISDQCFHQLRRAVFHVMVHYATIFVKKRKSKSGKQNKRRIKGGLDVIALWRCQDQFYAKYFDVQSHITLHEGNQNAMKQNAMKQW
uniref:RING-type domain-containing protein n=1 Tax=Ascaris lumbricoides TaxID=6252 RepID=A0A9J2Q3Z5_ASCLU